jgi:glycosyltransferase involved in cell wall biosynthesis
VVTVHDILFESHPQYFSRSFAWRSRWLIGHALRHADRVCTVSEYCRQEILRRYDIEPKRLTLVSNGVDLERFTPGTDGADHVRARGLFPGAYILSVGRLEPRKNHLGLVRAYARLGNSAPPLVLAGQRDFGYEALFLSKKALGLEGRVHIFEDVSDGELPALYRHAQVFAYPSFAEGFGVPPLEAMASGTPVITSSVTALPEVVAEAALLVDPQDTNALTANLQKLLQSPNERERLRNAGLQRARSYPVAVAASRLLETYRSLAPSVESSGHST